MHEAVFVDSQSLNVVSGIPSSSLDSVSFSFVPRRDDSLSSQLRLDAKRTLDKLNQSSVSDDVDPFEEVFLKDSRKLSARYDIVLR